MKKVLRLAVLLFLLVSCQSQPSALVTILDGGKTCQVTTRERRPAALLVHPCNIALGKDDRLLYLGAAISPEAVLPQAKTYTLQVRRAVTLTLVKPGGQQAIETSAATVGQALAEAGLHLYAADRLDPPAGTPITVPLTVTYTPARALTVSVDGHSLAIRSAAATVGQALSEAGIPLEGLDTSLPVESAPLPKDGRIRVVRVTEAVTLTQKSIPFNTRTELTADLELDQQSLLQGGEAGLAVTRTRSRLEDGVQVSQQTEAESLVRPPQDRVVGYGTKIVFHTAVVDGQTITYWRALRLFSTSYSPCHSAGEPGKCYYGTSSGMPLQKGVVAMIYYWYLLFGGQPLYIPGYGYATVGDVGASPQNHYWIDLGFSEEQWPADPPSGWVTVYFLPPVQANPGYILP